MDTIVLDEKFPSTKEKPTDCSQKMNFSPHPYYRTVTYLNGEQPVIRHTTCPAFPPEQFA